MKRVESIDIVRGIVMVIMALDHTRDLLHVDSLTQQPTDLTTATPMLFFTRWITHLCAPTFVFLSGVSAYISKENHLNVAGFRNKLLVRGLWLILLDFTIVGFGLWFDVHFQVLLFNVLAAIGFGFFILALLLKCSGTAIFVAGLFIMLACSFIPVLQPGDTGVISRILSFMVSPGAVPFGDGRLFMMGYPPIPWLAIMLFGYASGSLFSRTSTGRRRVFVYLGLTCLSLFMILRSLNIYGDPAPWSKQPTPLYTVLSFLNVTKYPPSLSFGLCMLGLMFLILAAAEKLRHVKIAAIFSVYGKVPLFYFLIHWYILHFLLFIVIFAQGYTVSDMVFGTNFGRPKGISGVSLLFVYVIWLTVVASLYPLCKWFSKLKSDTNKKRWVRYL